MKPPERADALATLASWAEIGPARSEQIIDGQYPSSRDLFFVLECLDDVGFSSTYKDEGGAAMAYTEDWTLDLIMYGRKAVQQVLDHHFPLFIETDVNHLCITREALFGYVQHYGLALLEDTEAKERFAVYDALDAIEYYLDEVLGKIEDTLEDGQDQDPLEVLAQRGVDYFERLGKRCYIQVQQNGNLFTITHLGHNPLN